jgi:hypothetical protein
MNELAQVIADLVRAGTDPDLVGRVAAAIANVRHIDEQAERRRAADRARKAVGKSGIPQNSAESADLVSPLCPPLSPTPPNPPYIPPSIQKPTRNAVKTELPSDWEPDGKTWKLAEDLGFTSQEAWDQLERMRDWAKNADGGKGRKSDWNAAFRNWLKRTADERRTRPQTAVQRNSLANSFAILDAVTDEAIRRSDGCREEGGEEDSFGLPGLRKSAA